MLEVNEYDKMEIFPCNYADDLVRFIKTLKIKYQNIKRQRKQALIKFITSR